MQYQSQVPLRSRPLKPHCKVEVQTERGNSRRYSKFYALRLKLMLYKVSHEFLTLLEAFAKSQLFSPVHKKSREAHGLRALLSTRKALLKKTIDLANEVRGLLKIFGIRLPQTVKHGSFDGVVRIDDILAHALVPLLDARVVLCQHYLELDRRVKWAASQDDVCMRFMTVPGVGPITALTFKAAVDDPSRFKKSRTVAAHFGLTPRRYQSGEHDNPGRISKAGDRDVRATLYAAANALLMRTMVSSQIKSWGMRLIRTKGRRRAVVAVARKLAVLLHRMWIDGTEFRQEPVGGMA
tara:strand:+ start:17633 stop:18517 length:885 start_codon:yes stop_codon:yes gene_type:complete